MAIIFRNAVETDVPEIIDLCNESFNENTSVEYAMQAFEQSKNNPCDIYIVGVNEENGEIVSHVKVTIVTTMFEGMGNFGLCNHVCVKPTYRGQKICASMIDYVRMVCAARYCGSIRLWSSNFREAAHRSYINNGFEPQDVTVFFSDLESKIKVREDSPANPKSLGLKKK